ncbi:MAG: hypothetical protein EOO54_18720 [Haliea sp.]|nr:MAG: hypothetical protein EOO54_18720 [Haliea sp.]
MSEHPTAFTAATAHITSPAPSPGLGHHASVLQRIALSALFALSATALFGLAASPARAQTAGAANAVPAPPPPAAPRTAAASAATSSGAARASFPEQALTGSWYGESGASTVAGAQTQRFLTTRRADGTYSLEVRTYEMGKPTVKLTNTGLWGISNSLFFTLTTEVNGQRTAIREPAYTSAYLVRSITANEFVYQHIASGKELRVVRTSPDARLPD